MDAVGVLDDGFVVVELRDAQPQDVFERLFNQVMDVTRTIVTPALK